MWEIRLVPGCIIKCTTDGAARVIDVVIITHLKARCKSVYSFMVDMDTTEYKERVISQGTIPEFDSYHPYLGRDKHGELKPPREEGLKALFEKKKSSEGEIGGRNGEVHLWGTIGARILCRLMKHLVETGMKLASFTTIFADDPNMSDKEREALRRRSSSMVRKLILGTFGVRSYDY